MVSVTIIRGGGCHAAVVYEQIASKHGTVMIWNDTETVHPVLSCVPRFDSEINRNILSDFNKVYCYVAVGSGSMRRKLVESAREFFASFKSISLIFPSVVHKTAIISPTARIGQGCFIGPLQ